MFNLPFALVLTDPRGSGRHDAIATFREVADLWTFWSVWREEVEAETVRDARFVQVGAWYRVAVPHERLESAKAWAQERNAA